MGKKTKPEPRYAFGPFLGMTEAEAADFQAAVQEESRYLGEDKVHSAAWYTLCEGKTLAQMQQMWTTANTKDHGVVQLGPYLYQEQMELLSYVEQCRQENRPCEILLLKARQLGMSTVIINMLSQLAALVPNTRSLVVAHKESATAGLLEKAEFSHRNMLFRPAGKFSRRMGGQYANGSTHTIESAEGKEAGRSFSYNFVHLSESAFYPRDREFVAAIMATLPTKGFYVLIQETTANGAGGQFYEAWQLAEKGESGYKPFFFPWHRHVKYRMHVHPDRAADILDSLDTEEVEGVKQFGWTPEQLAWRRYMISTKFSGDVDKFRQEYPATPLEAFITAGRPCFDKKAMLHLAKSVQNTDPVFRGDIRLVAGTAA